MSVDLGFIDESVKLLESRFFPSKVGGKPAWLNLSDIPVTDELKCKTCHSPMLLLCQLYCPIEEKDTTFHRTIFVFLCTSKGCFHLNSNSNFVVYRNQLPKCNSFYPDTPPIENLEWRPDIIPTKFGVQVCSYCGIRSECVQEEDGAECFCSKEHQQPSRSSNILPEYGLRIEPEDISEPATDSEESESEEEQWRPINIMDYNAQLSELCKIASAQDDPTVERIFKDSKKGQDKAFINFRTCIKAQPEQVIRYDRSGTPLWLSEKHIPSEKDIPKCEYCGKCRIFEFQILPQLLNHLKFDQEVNCGAGSLDWGTLAIYTCQDSCDNGYAYKKEFLWKQDIQD